MDIVVFGAGSLGSLLGGLFARTHDVTLVGRQPHVGAIRENGLHISGAIETTVSPDAREKPPQTADLAVVCVKAFDTETAAETLSRCALDACLSVQNGLGNEVILAEHLDVPVLAGTCTYGAVCPEPGTVECTGVGRVVLGPKDGGRSALADRVGEAFEAADIVTTVAPDMPERLWEKLAVNAGINATTALARVENGAVIDGDGGSVAAAAARETAAVAQSEGISLDETTAEDALTRVAEATAENTSSMQQDVLDGRRTEVDAINGYVERRGQASGIDVPVNATLARLLRAWETARGVR
ncbi:MAG: 2-dehydropantoate 2-reductase [Natronomonas sp.]